MSRTRPLLIYGTRPEAIKMAPVVAVCRKHEALEPVVCVTGQHREMLDQVNEYFGIVPDIDLAVMRPGQTLAELTARLLEGIDATLARYQPDCIVAQGDTTTVLAGALAAFYRKLPFVHVEAGLRTGNLQAPFPEEMNRRVATLAAALHCAPTQRAADTLLAEGAAPALLHVTGNTVIDALLATAARERARSDHWQSKYKMLGRERLVLITGHRRESFGEGIENICEAIRVSARQFTDVWFLYPLHLNPSVQEPVRRMLDGLPNVILAPPAAYPEFVWLMDRSSVILTDSGGVQEEAPSLGKPVLVTRTTTERPEAVEAGIAELIGTDTLKIVERLAAHLDGGYGVAATVRTNPYGDGHAAERIVELIAERRWCT